MGKGKLCRHRECNPNNLSVIRKIWISAHFTRLPKSEFETPVRRNQGGAGRVSTKCLLDRSVTHRMLFIPVVRSRDTIFEFHTGELTGVSQLQS